MGKVVKSRKSKAGRRSRQPLGAQIAESALDAEGTLSVRSIRVAPVDQDDDEPQQLCLSAKMTEKIFKQAQEQKEEIEAEESGLDLKTESFAREIPSLLGVQEDDQEGADFVVDEGDYEEVEINEEDEQALNMYMPSSQPQRRTLADLIMDKIREKEERDADPDMYLKRSIPEKAVTVYCQVGVILSRYRSGKLPKAIKIVPSLKNWEEIMYITKPESWSLQALAAITRLFASNFCSRMAQRFYNLVLLPRIRDNISEYKRLNFHLYMALRKAIFKPAAFFKGILLPLAEDACTAQEAVILGSILNKISIPMMHSGAAILKLTQLPYSGPTVMFIKTLLNKKYSLPYSVIQGLVKFFLRFKDDSRSMPVVWHQCFLVFAQRYKKVIRAEHKDALKAVLKAQHHHLITDEIRRELFAPPLLTDTTDVCMTSS